MSNLRFLLARALSTGIVRGGERPEFVDTSREGNRGVAKAGKGGGGIGGWSKKPGAAAPTSPTQADKPQTEPTPQANDDLQRGYEQLFQ